jgi:hypothetical protein
MRGQEESRVATLFRADGVMDPENLLNNHPGASRHPSCPGGGNHRFHFSNCPTTQFVR